MDTTVDLAAVNRVAKRVELKGVRLAKISAEYNPQAIGPSLTPSVNLECKVGSHGSHAVEVLCDYTFTARSGEAQAIDSVITYLLVYEISDGESTNMEDLTEFARANGALHSWPFVRELLYGLTSRMGYPPYTLPVMHFNTTTAPAKEQSAEKGVSNTHE